MKRTNRSQSLPSSSVKAARGLAIAAMLALAGLSTVVESRAAAILSWSGGSGSTANWDDPANWGFAGTPTNGDTLIFSASQPRLLNTNNIANLTLNQIRFVGAGGAYDIRGNAFTITNNIEGTNSAGTNTIENNIIMANADQILDVSAGGLTLAGVLSGAVGVIKNGAGVLTFSGANSNSFSGTTLVLGGTLLMGKTGPLGAAIAVPNSLVLSNGTTARLLQSWQIYHPGRSLALTTTLYPSSLLDLNGNSDWLAQVSMTAAQISSGTGLFYLSGDITVVSNSITASGISGNLILYSFGSCTNNTVKYAGTQFGPDLFVSANVSSQGGTNTLINAGPGSLWLSSAANTYQGETIVSGGELWISQTNGLGNTNLPATVKKGACLFLLPPAVVGLKPLVLNGIGDSYGGALVAFGSCSWAGNITLASDTSLGAYSAGQILNLSGAISGPGALIVTNGGTVTLSGPTDNTYAGLTTVSSGILLLSKALSYTTAIPGNVDVFGTLRLANFEQISDAADVKLEPASLFDLGIYYETIDTLRGSGGVTFGAAGYLTVGWNNGSSTYDGVMSGVGYGPGYTVGKYGTGTFTMNGANTFTAGNTRAVFGKLVINGFQPKIPAVIDLGGTLGGTGTVSTIFANGTIAPGNSPGVLTSSNVTFTSSGSFTVELTGPNPGVGGYDQLNVHGSNTLANATLNVIPAFTTPVAVGQTFTIINNDAAEPINGIFNGLPQGGAITTNGYSFTISYVGTGNDVTLTLTNIPGAAAGYSVSLGNGSGTIDPNECNYLSLVISNKTGTPMTGVSATLLSATPNVMSTQPFAPYSDAPGNGRSTNATPFQLSTTTNFVCGTPINLQLAITTASHGSFIVPFVLPSGSPSVVPSRYDQSTITNIPDIGTIESTNVVAGFVGPIAKVAVSLWLTHPVDSDLTISLISPNGTNVTLVSATGSGANFGSSCSPDASRTTFDDDAATPIAAGSPPFVGAFQPQAALASLDGTNANGNWRLRITDSLGGSVGALRCWSLFLYPVTCSSGGGLCELCPNTTITGATGPGSLLQTNNLTVSGIPSTCGSPKTCPGTAVTTSFPCDNYTFRNGPSNSCITVTAECDSIGEIMLASAYLGSYDPLNPNKCVNYLADGGTEVGLGVPTTFSFNVASNAVFVVNVISASSADVTQYKLTVSGGDCRPVLNINPAGPNKVQLDWTTAAANYRLESTNQLVAGATNWPSVTNIPIVVNSRFRVTNSAAINSQFYRLHKP